MNNDYKLIFESYSKHILEADDQEYQKYVNALNSVQAGQPKVGANTPSTVTQRASEPQAPAPEPEQEPAQQQPQQLNQPQERSVSEAEVNELSKYINDAYESQNNLLNVLLQKNVLDQASKNELASAAYGALASLARDLVYSAAQNNPQKILTLRNNFHKNIQLEPSKNLLAA